MALQVWLPLNGDFSNHGLDNSGSFATSTSFATSGKIGSKSLLSNAQRTTTFNSLIGVSNFTLAYWIKIDSSINVQAWSDIVALTCHVGNNDAIICGEFTNSNGHHQLLVGKDKTLGSNTYDYYTVLGGAASDSTDQWAHYTLVKDNTNVKVYINGTLRQTSVNTSFETAPQYLTGTVQLGITTSTAAMINDVRVYDEALSPLEIKRISQGLIAHYPLNDRYIESTTNLITTEDCLSATCYNGATSKYSYGTNTDMYKTVGDFNGKHGTKVYMGTNGVSCFPYVYVSNLYVSNGTNQPEYKTLSFDYYGTVGGYLGPYKLGSGSGTATYSVTCKGNTTTGSYTNSGFLPVIINDWNHVEITLHGTTEANAEWGYIRIGNSSHTSDTSNYWLFANMQIETKDHATPYVGVGGTRSETTVYDASGYCHNGTTTGDFAIYTDSTRYGASTYFEDYTRYIECPFSFTPTEVTMSCWINTTIKSTAKGGYHIMMNNNNGTSYELSIYGAAGQARIGYYVNGTRYVNNVGPDICDGEWHMVASTYDGTAIKRYIDGELVSTSTVAGTLNSFVKLRMGNLTNSYGNTQLYQSDCRIYATALSADDIKALYENSAYIATDGTAYAYEYVEV